MVPNKRTRLNMKDNEGMSERVATTKCLVLKVFPSTEILDTKGCPLRISRSVKNSICTCIDSMERSYG